MFVSLIRIFTIAINIKNLSLIHITFCVIEKQDFLYLYFKIYEDSPRWIFVPYI